MNFSQALPLNNASDNWNELSLATDDQRSPFTILLVDDLPENLVSLEEMLQAPDRTFLKAYNGNDALQIALKNQNIGLIMLDVQMPGMDGFEVAQLLQLNTATKKIPVIFVTAVSKEERFVLKGFAHGAVDFLHKPLNVSITRAKVKVFETLYFTQLGLRNSIEEKNIINKQLENYTKTVAHDLKTPLAGMISLVNLLQMNEKIQTIEDVREEMEMLSELSSNLSDMISSMLEESRKKDTDQLADDIALPAFLSQIISLLRPAANMRVLFEYNLPVIKAKKWKLQQVFQNLIGNALKYIDKPSGEIFIGYADKGLFHEFFVQDNGPGISSEDLPRIFDMYQTASNKSAIDSSTGIGLSNIKAIVEEQKGKIWVESELNKGCKFFFTWKK